ncbi:MAG: ABC transporter substrate-binding protein [Salinivirgaceae bacterium]
MKVSFWYSIFLVTASVLFIVGFNRCNRGNNQKRGEKYGGVLYLNSNEVPDLVFPGQVLKRSEQMIVSQAYIGLVKYNARNLSVEPLLAENWTVSEDGLNYRFELVNQAYFHDDPCFHKGKGRRIVASDVKYSIEQICHYRHLSQQEISTQVQNIKGFQTISDKNLPNGQCNLLGIKVINDTILVFELSEPDALFLHFLAGTQSLVFPQEAFDAYGFKSTIGSGPFCFRNPENKTDPITLVANPKYFGKNRQKEQLPFLDSVVVSFISSPPKEMQLFEQGLLHLVVDVDHSRVSQFLDKHIDRFQSNPPYYLMIQTTTDNDTKVHLMRANVQDLHLNTLGYYDFSSVYFMEPKPREIKIGQ